jgi:hypothetical protein
VRLGPRRKATANGEPEPVLGALDPVIWTGVAEVATAAHARNAYANLDAFKRLGEGRSLAHHRLAGLYATYLLKYRTAYVLGRRPAVEDVSAIAARLQRDFERVLPGSPAGCLVDTLLLACELNSARATGTYSTFTLRCLVALGLLLDAPSRDLASMQPHLADWCVRSARTIRTVTEGPPTR